MGQGSSQFTEAELEDYQVKLFNYIFIFELLALLFLLNLK